MDKVILQGYIEVPESELESVLAALPRHIELTRAEEGCLVFEVKQDPTDIYKFWVYEEFSNQEAFSFHQARVKTSRWWEVTKRLKRHYSVRNE